MTADSSESHVFRSATEFPKTIEGLEKEKAEHYYTEIRRYLISTNRSQGQLRRHNQNYREQVQLYKHEIQELQGTRDRLQSAVQSLTTEKSALMQQDRTIIQALESELKTMTGQIDVLAGAFGNIVDFDDSSANWGSPNLMQRIRNFLRATRNFMSWWNQQEQINPASDPKLLDSTPSIETSSNPVLDKDFNNRQQNPQLYTDPASVNRSLLEDS